MLERNGLKIDFMIIGAQKSGTSSLAHQLTQHPQVCFCIQKEPHYFSTTKNWESSLSRYHRLFDPKPGQLCGEASTSYTFIPENHDTPQRLHSYNPDLKLIYIVRHPVERIVSQFAHDTLRNRVKSSLEDAVSANPSYITRSCYAMQIEPYFELFPKENILLLVFEEFVADKEGTLKQVAQFLGIALEGFEGIDSSPQNASGIGGHLKLFPGLGLIKKLVYQLPAGLRNGILKTAKGPGHRYFYSVSETKPEISDALEDKLFAMVEGDISKLETYMGRPLDVFRRKIARQEADLSD